MEKAYSVLCRTCFVSHDLIRGICSELSDVLYLLFDGAVVQLFGVVQPEKDGEVIWSARAHEGV